MAKYEAVEQFLQWVNGKDYYSDEQAKIRVSKFTIYIILGTIGLLMLFVMSIGKGVEITILMNTILFDLIFLIVRNETLK